MVSTGTDVLLNLKGRIGTFLPEGRVLPDRAWRLRHRTIQSAAGVAAVANWKLTERAQTAERELAEKLAYDCPSRARDVDLHARCGSNSSAGSACRADPDRPLWRQAFLPVRRSFRRGRSAC
jgi:hypothetical protein